VFSERTTVGLDVHARSVVACGIDTVTGELLRRRLCPAHGEVLGWLSQLPGPVAVVYEAGPSGFGLARAVRAAGVRCEVAAPSKLQRPAGDRVKTDKLDAVWLANLNERGMLRASFIPPVEIRQLRDYTRLRVDLTGERSRHIQRLEKLLEDVPLTELPGGLLVSCG
jgi:transposase